MFSMSNPGMRTCCSSGSRLAPGVCQRAPWGWEPGGCIELGGLSPSLPSLPLSPALSCPLLACCFPSCPRGEGVCPHPLQLGTAAAGCPWAPPAKGLVALGGHRGLCPDCALHPASAGRARAKVSSSASRGSKESCSVPWGGEAVISLILGESAAPFPFSRLLASSRADCAGDGRWETGGFAKIVALANRGVNRSILGRAVATQMNRPAFSAEGL